MCVVECVVVDVCVGVFCGGDVYECVVDELF